MSTALIEVEDLRVTFGNGADAVHPVDGVTFSIAPGEIVGVVGESGSGKSMMCSALAQLVPYPGRVEATRLEFDGGDLLHGTVESRRQVLGTNVATVFQNPMTSLNPALRIRTQMTEALRGVRGLTRSDATRRAERRLEEVHISAPRTRLRQYPHELSGGMRQRVMIAMGMMNEPKLIIADEPTTALDVTVQAQVLSVLREFNEAPQTAVLLVSHDLGVIAQLASRVLVMYAGRVVEDGPIDTILSESAHPYTRALLNAVPTLSTDADLPLAMIPGRIPPLNELPTGCVFAPRCAFAEPRCLEESPGLEPLSAAHRVACWPALESGSFPGESRDADA